MRGRIVAAVVTATSLGPPLALVLTSGACFDFGSTMTEDVAGDAGSPADSGVSDADVTADDGAGDGAGDGDDGSLAAQDAGTFCDSIGSQSRVFLCESFDDGTQLPGLYFNVEGQTGGKLTKTTTTVLSPPDALDLKTSPRDGGTLNVALRENDIALPQLPETMTFAFALNPQQIDTKDGAALVLGAVDFLDVPGNRYSLGLAINVVSGLPALALDEQSGFADGGMENIAHVVPAANALKMKSWNDIVLTIAWATPTTGTASVAVNGVVGIQPFALTMTVKAASLQVGIGSSYVTLPSPAWELLYDNVTFMAR